MSKHKRSNRKRYQIVSTFVTKKGNSEKEEGE